MIPLYKVMEENCSPFSLMESPLVLWVKVIAGEKHVDYEQLCEGLLLLGVWQQIDPLSAVGEVTTGSTDICVRLRNYSCLINNIRNYYESVLGQLLLMPLPDILSIVKNPNVEQSVVAMKQLILLILGAAVQCEQKENFIEAIKTLDLDAQHAMVQYIQQVTDNPEAVWTLDSDLDKNSGDEQVLMLLEQHIQRLTKERDELLQRVINLVLEQEAHINSASVIKSEKSHLVVELAEVKSRLRKLQQECVEKTECVNELKEDLQETKEALEKSKHENVELLQSARAAKAYKDEIDILKEKTQKLDQLENEVQRYRDKITELEFYKSRVEELREDNRILHDTKDLLEEQLDTSRKRAERVVELESDVLKYLARIDELCEERDAHRIKLHELMEENATLQMEKKLAFDEVSEVEERMKNHSLSDSPSLENSLHEQLNTDAQTRALQLELENQRLQGLLDGYKTSSLSSSLLEEEKTIKLERQNQKMKSEVHQLKSTIEELQKSKSKLDEVMSEKQRLCAQLQHQKEQLSTLEKEHSSCEDLKISSISLNSENQRLHRTLEAQRLKVQECQNNLDLAENENQRMKETLAELRTCTSKLQDFTLEVTELEAKNYKLEQEKKGLEKEILRLKNSIEFKDKHIDECSTKISTLERENKHFQKEMENWYHISRRVKKLERENKDLSQQAANQKSTLISLTEDLVSEKIRSHQITSNLEKQAMYQQNDDLTESDSGIFCRNEEDESTRYLTKEISELKISICNLEKQNSTLVEENASLRTEGSFLKESNASLQSKLVSVEESMSRLNGQHTTLQSQYARLEVEHCLLKLQKESACVQVNTLQAQLNTAEDEKEKLQQEKKDLQSIHDSISSDHEALQKLHDQLTTEYENLSSEYNALKSSHRSLKSDLAALKERSEKEIFSQEELEKLREILDQEKHLVDKQSFVDLQCKYCELKEEWNSLKESFDSLQVEHKKLQAAHKSLRTEDSNLKLENTRLKGDLVEFQDQAATLDIQVSKLIGYCKALFQANGIENEQGTLVDQIFSLLADYQNYLVSMSGDSFPSVTETELGRRLYVLTQEKKKGDKLVSRLQQELNDIDKRVNRTVAFTPVMRRTRSEQLSRFQRGRSYQDKGKVRSANLEITFNNSSRNPCDIFEGSGLVGSNLRGDSGLQKRTSSWDDDFPVRDVGPFLKLSQSQPSTPQSPCTNQELDGQSPSSNQPATSKSSHQTTIQNHTTVNVITNLGSPESKQSSPSNTGSPVKLERSALRQTLPHPYSSGSRDPGSALRSSVDIAKVRNRNYELSKLHRSKPGKDSENAVPETASGHNTDSSIWFEYGCV
ncbi:uncharacterized protein LOC143226703 isoform X1 [Tachypleus tridentatus]|uniref:uncharacterized protein LOC143226703 isoform X1 n=1 Tax=Tachypleus tridentatus TaxID=6853 RepID=UPI003FD00B48